MKETVRREGFVEARETALSDRVRVSMVFDPNSWCKGYVHAEELVTQYVGLVPHTEWRVTQWTTRNTAVETYKAYRDLIESEKRYL